MEETPLNSQTKQRPKVFTVTELSEGLRETLQDNFAAFSVQGEICDFKGIHRSGHLYCGLKDDKSQIRLVMWRSALSKVPFDLKTGLEVVVSGKLDYYPGTGSLQIVAEKIEPLGIGALQLKFEQLKAKLAAEGLFEASRKRIVSPLNWRIGLVTGRSTAALQDMLKIFKQRFPVAEVFLFHASVQGEKAPGEIVKAIELANKYSASAAKPLDVLIVGRGGGSYEDLFCFNDESVARALAQSKIPTVSAVGHEIDFTIADMVADKRAATPSHAAQETVPEMALWLQRLEEVQQRFSKLITNRISDEKYKLEVFSNRLIVAAPHKKLIEQRRQLEQIEARLKTLISVNLDRKKQSLYRLASLFDALSPLKVLDRGYSLVTLVDDSGAGRIVKSATELSIGDQIQVRLKDGQVRASVLSHLC